MKITLIHRASLILVRKVRKVRIWVRVINAYVSRVDSTFLSFLHFFQKIKYLNYKLKESNI